MGVNCHFGPIKSLEAMRLMKEGLDAAGIKCHLMVQPLGYHTPDCGIQGFIDLPEFPFGKQYTKSFENNVISIQVNCLIIASSLFTSKVIMILFVCLVGLEPRICTRFDMHKFAREAYNIGIRYIGGCCGFEPYHIRAIAEEV